MMEATHLFVDSHASFHCFLILEYAKIIPLYAMVAALSSQVANDEGRSPTKKKMFINRICAFTEVLQT
ncbi:hypothetical protein Syun_001190 [Stephania yunnanensis]|uniref:Uncharacterized protein n=1 Tax=Stephania yunnanensis TaxID=152371 RepID=A0AAP0LG62_9MAGN